MSNIEAMDFSRALQAMRDGLTVRRKSWPGTDSLSLDVHDGTDIFVFTTGECNNECYDWATDHKPALVRDLLAVDWMIVEEA